MCCNAEAWEDEEAACERELLDLIRDKVLRNPVAELDAADDLIESGLLDSMGILELVGLVESNYSIILTESDLRRENFCSARAIAAFLRRKRTMQRSHGRERT